MMVAKTNNRMEWIPPNDDTEPKISILGMSIDQATALRNLIGDIPAVSKKSILLTPIWIELNKVLDG